MNSRLTRSVHRLSKSFSCELLVTTYSRSYPGVRITIQEGAISFLTLFTAETPHPAKFGERGPDIPNMCAPRGPLTQLFMGYLSWPEITTRVPDAIAAPYITPVINILFPKVTASSCAHFLIIFPFSVLYRGRSRIRFWKLAPDFVLTMALFTCSDVFHGICNFS